MLEALLGAGVFVAWQSNRLNTGRRVWVCALFRLKNDKEREKHIHIHIFNTHMSHTQTVIRFWWYDNLVASHARWVTRVVKGAVCGSVSMRVCESLRLNREAMLLWLCRNSGTRSFGTARRPAKIRFVCDNIRERTLVRAGVCVCSFRNFDWNRRRLARFFSGWKALYVRSLVSSTRPHNASTRRSIVWIYYVCVCVSMWYQAPLVGDPNDFWMKERDKEREKHEERQSYTHNTNETHSKKKDGEKNMIFMYTHIIHTHTTHIPIHIHTYTHITHVL